VANEGTLLQQAVTLHRDGKLGAAQRRYEDVLKLNPRNHDAQRLLGVVEFQRGNHRAARRILAEAVRMAPQVADAHYFLGRCLSETGEFAEAVTAFDAALVREPRHENAAISLAQALVELGSLDDALARLDMVVAGNPRQRDALYHRGSLLRRLTRYDDALESYDRAIVLDPSFVAARLERGELLLFAGRAVDAAEDFAACLRGDPASFAARLNLAQAQLQMADRRATETGAGLLDQARREKRALPLSLLLAFGATPADILTSARHHVAAAIRKPTQSSKPPAVPRERVRIAYLSSDFREHPVAYVTAGLLERPHALRCRRGRDRSLEGGRHDGADQVRSSRFHRDRRRR
jgi:tetratricopeptide (TPR) repeat protein